MIPGIATSLKDRADLIAKGYWVRYYAEQQITSRSVAVLDIGYVLSNGDRERAIATRVYFFDGSYTVFAHA